VFRRFAVALLCALVLPVSAAQAWTWPVDGPVLRPFSFDRAHPYAAGQHRGVDLGAQSGTDVHAPASGVVTFAGTVPTGGKTVSIQTPFGHTATLVHLGSINVTRGAPVTEGAVVGTVGPSGVVDLAEPFVYFGVRVTSDDQGYVDPLPFLPARPAITAPPESKASVETPAAPASGEAASTTGAQPVAPPQPAKDTATAPPVETIAAEPAAVGTQVATQVADAPAAVAPAAPKVSRRTQGRSDVVARGTSAPGASIEQSATSDESRAEPSTLETVPLVAPVVARELRHAHSIAPSVTATASQRSHARGDSGGSTAAGGAGGVGWLVAFAAIVVVVCSAPLVVRAGRRKAARIMSSVESEPSFVRATAKAQDLGGARLAVCVGEATPGPRGRVRGTGGHLRALPPPEGQRRLDGERHGRARDTRDGRGRSRGRLAA
jgi:hypothetical protein